MKQSLYFFAGHSFGKSAFLIVALFFCTGISALQAQVIYVTPSGAGTQTGASWANAAPGSQLQTKINGAAANTQVWVAAGTYKPNAYPGGCSGCGSVRDYTFALKNDVALYGGFSGTEVSLLQRIGGNTTILSGDIGTVGDAADNCYHVVISINNTSTTILDGFTITGGNANMSSSITVSAYVSSEAGSALLMSSSYGQIKNCIFYANNVTSQSVNNNGALYINFGQPGINNCAFIANNSNSAGSAITIANCASPVSITNCTFYGNGGASDISNYSSSPAITNCIIWSSLPYSIYNYSGTPTVTYSLVKGGFTGTGNLNTDPLFFNSNDPDGVDNILGTSDDGLRLLAGSPAINTGSNAAATGITTDITRATRIQNTTVDMGAYEGSFCPVATTLYVDNAVAAPGNGSTWATAFKELRDAVAVAQNCNNVTTLLVAKGTYKPTNNANRDSAIAILRGGLKIYGGYPIGGGTRNVATNPTILSGDIGTPGNSIDNSYHVLVLAGIDNSADSVVLDGCTILNGTASGSGTKLYNGQNTNHSNGGGLYLLNNAAGSKIVIRNCSFTNNSSSNGGAVYSEASSPVFSNSNFVGNVAGSQGGAVYAYNNASPTFRNCFFRQNIAQDGGAISVFFYSPYSVNNCVFVQNNASGRGGAIYATNNSPATITNCTLVQNNAEYGGAMSFNVSSNTGIINTVAWGNTATAYPLFFNNSFITVDHSLVQEGYAGTGNVNADPLFINSADADGPDNIFGTTDDGLHLQAGSPAINTGNNTAIPAGVTTDITGAARIQDGTVDMGAYEGSVCPSFTTLYVDSSIASPGNGSSWATAFKELSSAMVAAGQCNSIITINVAKGTYKPTNDTNRDSTFAILRGGLKIYGGYPTGGGTRDIVAYTTVLSGDLGVVDDNTDNSYHIIIIANPGSNADSLVIDGFTITKANAKGTGTKLFNGINISRNDGGGIYSVGQVNSKTVIRNCTITANTAFNGGGGLNSQGGSSPTLINSTFANNSALLSGGAILNDNCLSFIKGCKFIGNNAFFGGGIRNSNSSVVVDSCIFSNNTGNDGGGAVQNEYSSPFFSKCIFINNFSQGGSSGGGMANIDGSPVVTNCMFIGNYSFENGTAVSNQNSQALFNSCTFSANYGNAGSVISTYGTIPVVVTNSIIWGNTKVSNGNPTVSNPVIYNSGGANTTITYSNVQGGYSGTGNISIDPLFINSADADGADNIFGTADDGLHLQAGSPAINTGSNAAVPAGVTTDITGAARIQDGTVDMGAYEGSQCPSFTTLYVDSSIASPGKGGSWATAFKTVQQALDASNSCSGVKQVWIKKGTYYPTAYPTNCTGCASNGTARDYTFALRDGLALYGGFAGTETDTAQRVAGNTTILSGDIGTPNNNSDNCYHVLLAINSNNRLNGLTVTGGNANDNGVITVNGEAIYHSNGGGMYEYASSSALFNCTFTANAASSEGGGMYTVYCSALRIRNSRYLNNHSGAGGAIRLLYGNTSFVSVNTVYAGNTASFNDGGALSLVMGGGTDTLINNVFIKNVASGSAAINGGGALVQEDGTSSYIVNNTFYADSAASNGGAVRFKAGGSNRYVYNNIFYKSYNGTSNTDISLESGTTITAQSNNLYSTTNPLFINESNPAGADNIFGTADDGLHLQMNSPAINKGSNAAIPAGTITDMAGTLRIQDGIVDMGAYESNAVILPLTLVQFSGKTLADNNAVLSWRTANEINTSHFELQRSMDGRSFTAITTIQAKGTNTGIAEYGYTDKNLQPDTYYYRLHIVDKDGQTTYSSVVAVQFKSSNLLTLYPVPAKDVIWLGGGAANQTGKTALLIDMQGRILKQISITQWPQRINVSELVPGNYIIKLPEERAIPFIKQ